ncbi:UNKNOWN [Stylonychia lemnae]|uniref:Uncharacterized protein n=1 Tax=Stylonychia lemnae TaxID=5949 RepID=A0A078A627_STYLE|nr:UNKNOWN [Stylonychia lemnae]|eukprot:CDW77010.1 UNKNOWN [Stylonychia lemnae]
MDIECLIQQEVFFKLWKADILSFIDNSGVQAQSANWIQKSKVFWILKIRVITLGSNVKVLFVEEVLVQLSRVQFVLVSTQADLFLSQLDILVEYLSGQPNKLFLDQLIQIYFTKRQDLVQVIFRSQFIVQSLIGSCEIVTPENRSDYPSQTNGIERVFGV